MLLRLWWASRLLMGLLLVLAHVVVQPGKAAGFVICSEQDGRVAVEFRASGSCQHPAAVHEVGAAKLAAPCCEGCTDRLLPPEPAPTLSGKRGEAPPTILLTGPPNAGDALVWTSGHTVDGTTAASGGGYSFFGTSGVDPFLVSLRSVRLLT